MENKNKILGYYLNKPVYRVNSKFNEGEYYINFNNNNYTLPSWKKQNNHISLYDAIEAINYKLDNTENEMELKHLKNGLIKQTVNDDDDNIDIKAKLKKYNTKLQQEYNELDEIEQQIKQLKLKRKEKLDKIETIENKIIELKPKKHKIDLQKIPTDIIKHISKYLINNDDFRFNKIMHCKIDIGLTNFFFPNNFKVYNYFTYLGPNIETQYYNFNGLKSLASYKNELNLKYAITDSKKVVSYFKTYHEFLGWKEYNEADNYRESFEARQTQPSYNVYIEAFDNNDKSLSKINLNDIKHTLTDYKKCVPLGNLDSSIERYLEKITKFKLLDD